MKLRRALLPLILLLGSTFASHAPAAPAAPAVIQRAADLRPGDFLLHRAEDGGWQVSRVLAVDDPAGDSTVHVSLYRKTAERPTVADLDRLEMLVMHAPIAGSAFKGDERLANRPLAKGELEGFVHYLKLTDFPRYLKLTGQNVEVVVKAANSHYRQGYQLSDAGRREEAIAEYTAAIDLFPLFYEAIDNRGLLYMELGRLEEALADFEASLKIEPDGLLAFFERGECMAKLGRLEEAEAVFTEGATRFPEKRDIFTRALADTRAARAAQGK